MTGGFAAHSMTKGRGHLARGGQDARAPGFLISVFRFLDCRWSAVFVMTKMMAQRKS
jgi:hypothetical protein